MPPEPEPRTSGRRAAAIRARRFFLLFLFLLGSLVYYPYAGDSGVGYLIFRLLGFTIILLSVYALSVRRGAVLIALVFAIPSLLVHSQLLRRDASVSSVLGVVLSFAFDTFVIVVIFRRVFAHVAPDTETIFGALCAYLLIGFAFASVYGLVNDLQPAAFFLNPTTNTHTVATRFDFVYYSFATMTAVGAAGITAVSDQARSLSVIESIIGVLYIACMIARLISSYRLVSGAAAERARADE
jgi:hypothetical protein